MLIWELIGYAHIYYKIMNKSIDIELTASNDKMWFKWYIGKIHHLKHESVIEDWYHEIIISVDCLSK